MKMGWRAGLCVVLLAVMQTVVAQGPHYELSVRLDPQARTLDGRAVIHPDTGTTGTLALPRDADIDAITVDGRAHDPTQPLRVDKARRIEVRWRARLAPLDAALDHRRVLSHSEAVADPRGSFLPASSGWHPRIEGTRASYMLALDLPAGQRGLVAGTLVDERETDGRYHASFRFATPAEGIDLVAGPYRVTSDSVRAASGKRIALRTYFHAEIAALSADYLDAVERYIALYETWIGAYPFDSFSVVSSPTPTGFGMPTFTYLGIDVLRLPFIRDTSLGHEVLHNWWGNGVLVDYARGNWAEGLTTFMADYAYKEQQSAAAAQEMRLGWLRDYAALPAGADAPLASFTARTHGAAQVIGYNKAAMVFVMLRDLLGADAFDRGVRLFWRERRYRVAAWSDLRRAFEMAAERDLGVFFSQWIERAGAADLRIADARREGDAVRVTLVQREPAYRVRVPLVVVTDGGAQQRSVELEGARATFALHVAGVPHAVALDPDLRVFRRLADGEAPPILRQAMLDASTEAVLLADGARELAGRLLEHAPHARSADAAPGQVPLLVIGLHGDVDRWLGRNGLARPVPLRDAGTAQAWIARRPDGNVVAVVSAQDAQSLAALARPLPHYGAQSYVIFDGSRAIGRGVWPSVPQVWKLD